MVKINILQSKHNKKYDSDEEQRRFAIFKENIKKIEEHNKKFDAGEESYKMGVTQFADQTEEERKSKKGLLNH